MTKNVKSFELDHRTVRAPYVRVADVFDLGGGHFLTKYDVRLCQPNQKALPTDATHSLEHMMAEFSRNHTGDVIDISPMGCRTGFYVLLKGDHSADDTFIFDLLVATFEDILAADEVPAANEVQCGFAADHSLGRAKIHATPFLAFLKGQQALNNKKKETTTA